MPKQRIGNYKGTLPVSPTGKANSLLLTEREFANVKAELGDTMQKIQ